jgi:glutamyl-tRNA synthetase
MTIEALKTYILSQGASQREILLEWDKVWSLNKRVIDPIAPRHTSLDKTNIVPLNILEASLEVKSLPKHKKNADIGMKETLFGPNIMLEHEDAIGLEIGEEVTLMDWGNAIITSLVREGNIVIKVEAKLNLDGDFKKTKKKLTWLAMPKEKHHHSPVNVTLHDFDYLIRKKKLEGDDKFEDFLSPKTEFITKCFGDSNLLHLKKGEIIQIERKG